MRMQWIPGDCVIYNYEDDAAIFGDPVHKVFTLFYDWREEEFKSLLDAESRLVALRRKEFF